VLSKRKRVPGLRFRAGSGEKEDGARDWVSGFRVSGFDQGFGFQVSGFDNGSGFRG